MTALPEWATKAAAEAGVSLEGWGCDDDCVGVTTRLLMLEVVSDGELRAWGKGEYPFHICHQPLPEAFRLAERLRRALDNEPDPQEATR